LSSPQLVTITVGEHLAQRLSAAASRLVAGDPVEGQVELAVTATIEAVADEVARPERHRRRPVMAGERGPRPEPADPTGLADELGRGEMTAAGQLEERGRDVRGDRHPQGDARGVLPRRRRRRSRRADLPAGDYSRVIDPARDYQPRLSSSAMS